MAMGILKYQQGNPKQLNKKNSSERNNTPSYS